MRQRSARGSAQSIDWGPAGILKLVGVTFTTCPRADESWLLRAKSISLDTVQQIGTGRGATVDFEGVPILYLPWISFPLSDERKSGFLFPSFGTSSTSGIELQVPYYWNIAPNADLTFEPQIYSKRGIICPATRATSFRDRAASCSGISCRTIGSPAMTAAS